MGKESQSGATAANGELQEPRPVLHHVNLKTTRLDEMVEWYGDLVGMESVYTFPGGAWLTNDGANHRLALLASDRFTEADDLPKRVGLHHLAFEFESMADLLATYVRFKDDRGEVPHMVLDHGMTLSFYFVDPDGNSVELQVDNFGDWSKSTDYMRTDPTFAANPIGVFCDPDQLVAAWRAGAGHDEVHRRALAGEFEPAEQPDLRADL
jgi:catechol 2,3-dioxygenase